MSEDEVTPQNPEPANPDVTAAIPSTPEPAAIPAAPDTTAAGPTWSASSEGPAATTEPIGAVAPPPGDAAPPPPGEPPTAFAMPGPAAAPSEPSGSKWSVRKALLIAALVLVLGLGGGFALGRATDDSGPSSLADAVHQTANGDLPLGDTNGSLQRLLQELNRNGGLQRALQNLFGQLGRNGNGRNVLPLNPNGNNNGNNNGGNNDNGGSNNGGNTPTPSTSQAFLGVAVTNSDNGQGVVIGTVQSGSPAADAGLKAGDVITAVDGTSVNSAAALSTAVRSHQPGDSVKITYTRNGTSADVQVRLGNRTTANTTVPTAPPA
jgi:hypothetical protein